MRRWITNRSFFSTMFISITIIVTFLVLILSLVLYTYVGQVVSRTLEEANRSNLAQISYSANYMDDSAKNLAFSIFKDSSTTPLMYSDTIETSDLVWEREQLSIWASSNPLVHSIYVYNGKTETYISSYTYAWERAGADKGIFDVLRKLGSEPKQVKPISRKIPLDVAGLKQTEVEVFTYVLYDYVSRDGRIEGAVIINIKADYLRDTVNTLASKSDKTRGNIVIVDKAGNLVMDATGNYEHQWNLQPMQDHDPASASLRSKVVTIGKDKMLATYTDSEHLDWTYINVIPYDLIYQPLTSIKRMTIGMCSIIVLAGFSLAYFVSRRIYFPIGELVRKVKDITESPSHHPESSANEMTYLSDRFSHTFHHAKSLDLKQQLRSKTEALHNLLLSRERLEMNSLCKSFVTHRLRLNPFKRYRLVFIQFDHLQAFAQRYTPRDQALIRFALLNVLEELLLPHYVCEVVDIGEDRMVCVLNLDEQVQEELLERMLTEAREWSSQYLRLSFTSTLGEVYEDMHLLNEAYQQVVQLSKYRFLLGHGALITKSATLEKSDASSQVPIPMMEKLLERLASGKGDQAYAQLISVIADARQGSYTSMLSILHVMIYRINQKIRAIEHSSSLQFNIDFNDFTAKLNEAETLDEVEGQFAVLFASIAQTILSKSRSRTQVIVDAVAKHIEEQYVDPNLSLQSLAETVKLSKVYLGQIYRESTGQSISDAITEVRIRHVLRIMQDHNGSVSDILERVGIENKNYFYKQFKKKMGVSLSDYKLRHLHDSK
ncbi:AraC family transcriptional regulator [Paenibacillus sp. 598K]|uniref:AraC family transcriptional regulator n=1 Tax=Paenibacillus sp. 598K TaxID=1117987 RepID=UPI000FFEC60F|nr:helix-turn-helix domain-containing protein [Paenibacillus sp. 598K]